MKNEISVKSLGVMSRQQFWKVIGLTLLVCGSLHGQQIIQFDVPPTPMNGIPGAGTGQYQGTWPTAINQSGVIVGFYIDASNVNHGFVRSSNGSFTNFDAPGAGRGYHQGTQAISINEAGTIVGYYIDSSYTTHNFLRAPNGTITNIDPPSFLSPGADSFYPIVINAAGVVAGNNIYPYPYNGGFLLTPGANTPSSLRGPSNSGFIPTGINSSGAIAGVVGDGGPLGLLRNPDGTIITFAPPDPTNTLFPYNTVTTGINPKGVITGYSSDNNGQHGFVWAPPTSRTPSGTFTAFDPPGAGFWTQMTYPSAISPAGTVTGYYLDFATYTTHGFLWTPPTSTTPSGTFTPFVFPGSISGDATAPSAINPAGEITGYWQAQNTLVYHGFLRTP